MKKFFFSVCAVALLSFAFVSKASADVIGYSATPFTIGPGQFATVKIMVKNAPEDIQSGEICFDLPEGVYIVGTVTDGYFGTSDYVLNANAINTKATVMLANRPEEVGNTGQYDLIMSDATGELFRGDACKAEGTWVLSFDVACEDGVAAGTGEVIFQDNGGGTFIATVSGGEVYLDDGDIDAPSTSVTVSDKFTATMAGSGYTSICSTTDLDFSAVEGLTAYVVSEADGEKATLTKIENAPAGTGVILKGTAGETYEIPTGSASAPADNLLVGVTARTKVTGDGTQFFLVGGKFVKAAEESSVPAGKAYLKTSAGAKEFDVLEIVFDDDEATAIKNVENEQFEGIVYNLNGVRVDNPTKGVYVKDGKKFVVK